MCCLSKTWWITVLFQVLSTRVFQELKKQVETAVELEKKLKVELKKKDKDLKTAQDVNKVCFFLFWMWKLLSLCLAKLIGFC